MRVLFAAFCAVMFGLTLVVPGTAEADTRWSGSIDGPYDYFSGEHVFVPLRGQYVHINTVTKLADTTVRMTCTSNANGDVLLVRAAPPERANFILDWPAVDSWATCRTTLTVNRPNKVWELSSLYFSVQP